ncbi:MAG: winged helix-turn-helix transcriptional regulator [Bacteroidetes bacterium]|nr:winged helix-turn-helix transcriptional regulator [Bacteroidota bacterium]
MKELGNPKEFLGYLMSHAMKGTGTRLMDNFTQAGFDVSKPQWFVLVRCFHFENEELLQSEVVEMMMGDKTAVTRAVDDLVKQGLVSQEIYKQDRRNRVLTLTTAGKEMVPKLMQCAMKSIDEVTQGISQSDMQITKRVLKQIIENSNKLNAKS